MNSKNVPALNNGHLRIADKISETESVRYSKVSLYIIYVL